jgi:hypothetical protein
MVSHTLITHYWNLEEWFFKIEWAAVFPLVVHLEVTKFGKVGWIGRVKTLALTNAGFKNGQTVGHLAFTL